MTVLPNPVVTRYTAMMRVMHHRYLTSRLLVEGQTVLELSSVLAGPSVSQFFAELGARVIKVENMRTRGDVTRSWKIKSEIVDTDRTAYFYCCNSGKQSIAIDVSKKAGLEIVQKLALKADIVIASYKPGDAEKLGVDYKSLRAINPRIIYACITGYGQKDDRAGYDAVVQAEAGFQYMNGSPDSLPCKMPVALVDVLAAHQLKQGILVGLLHRERTGEGSFVETTLIKSAVSSLANQAMGCLIAGAVPQRIGSEHPSICPYGTVFKTGDGKYTVLAVGTDAQFARLCNVVDCKDMADDDRFRSNASRVRNREACVHRLQQEIEKTHDRDEIVERLVAAKVPVAKVNAMDEVFQIPQANELVFKDPQTGYPSGLRQVAFDSTVQQEIRNLSVPPHYGEHTESVLTNVLELSKSDIEKLISSGIVDTYSGPS